MSQKDVEAVFGPQWVQDSLEYERTGHREATKLVLQYRTILCGYEPTLPHPLDGGAWHEFEKEWPEDMWRD